MDRRLDFPFQPSHSQCTRQIPPYSLTGKQMIITITNLIENCKP